MSKNLWKVVAIVEALLLVCIVLNHSSRITPDVNVPAVTTRTTVDVSSPVVTLRKVTYGDWQPLNEEKDFFYSFRQKQINDRMGESPTFVKRESDGAVIEYTDMMDLGEKPTRKWDDFRYIGTGKSYRLAH